MRRGVPAFVGLCWFPFKRYGAIGGDQGRGCPRQNTLSSDGASLTCRRKSHPAIRSFLKQKLLGSLGWKWFWNRDF